MHCSTTPKYDNIIYYVNATDGKIISSTSDYVEYSDYSKKVLRSIPFEYSEGKTNKKEYYLDNLNFIRTLLDPPDLITKGAYYLNANGSPVYTGFKTTNLQVYQNGIFLGYKNTDESGYYYDPGLITTFSATIPLQNEWVICRDQSWNVIQGSGSYPPKSSQEFYWSNLDATSVRWYVSMMHDYFYSTYGWSTMNFQINSLITNYNDINGRCEEGPYLKFGKEQNKNWARSKDVIFHEYSHAVIYKMYEDHFIYYYTQIPEPCFKCPIIYPYSFSMNEGFADYFTCAMNNNPIIGSDVDAERNLSNNYQQTILGKTNS